MAAVTKQAHVEGYSPELIRRTTKRARKRLAKAELIMALAIKTNQWARMIDGSDGSRPFEEWPDDDPFKELTIRYGLAPADLAKLLDGLGDDLEWRAERAGFSEVWRDDSI